MTKQSQFDNHAVAKSTTLCSSNSYTDQLACNNVASQGKFLTTTFVIVVLKTTSQNDYWQGTWLITVSYLIMYCFMTALVSGSAGWDHGSTPIEKGGDETGCCYWY